MHESNQEARSPGNVNGEKDQREQSNHSCASPVLLACKCKTKSRQRMTSQQES